MEKISVFRKILVIIFISILLSNLITYSASKINIREAKNTTINSDKISPEDTTEYWALIIAANCEDDWNDFSYYAEIFKDILLVSDHWDEDHIKTLFDEEVSLFNVIKEFTRLRWVADRDDVVTIFYPIGWQYCVVCSVA